MANRNKVAKVSVDAAARTVTYAWSDGVTDTFDFNKVPDEITERLITHGGKQKLSDKFAGLGEEGVASCRAAARATFDQMCEGDWDARGGSGVGIWITAIARATGKAESDVKATFEKLDDATKAKLKKHPDVAKAKLQIEQERLEARDADEGAPDLGAMFGESDEE